MAGNMINNPRLQYPDQPGGSLGFFDEDAHATPLDTFSDKELTVANENPVNLDSAGRPSLGGTEIAVFLKQQSYYVVLKNSAGTEIWDAPDVSNILQISVTGTPETNTVATMTALTKASLTDLVIYNVLGYTNKNDDGGDKFQWNASSTATEDLVTIFESDEAGTGRWLRIFTKLNPVMGGAIGDGVADDAAAIQRVITAIGATGLRLEWLEQTYLIQSQISAPFDFLNWNMGQCEILVDHAGIGIQVGDPSASTLNHRIIGGRITRNGFVASPAWDAGSMGIQFRNVNDTFYADYAILGFESGIQLRSSGSNGIAEFRSRPASVVRCKFPLDFLATDDGFINDIMFYGPGRISYAASDPDTTGAYAIHQVTTSSKGANSMNTHVYSDMSFQNNRTTNKPKLALLAGNFGKLRFRQEGFVEPYIDTGSDFQNWYFEPITGMTGRAALNSPTSQRFIVMNADDGDYIGSGGTGVPALLMRTLDDTVQTIEFQNVAGTKVAGIGSLGLDVGTLSDAAPVTQIASVTQTWDPGSIADGVAVSVSVTVAGALATDIALAGHNQIGTNRVILTAQAFAGAVRVNMANHTGGNFDLASGTLRVVLLRLT